ncbi:MAG TPA: M20 family metallopeptidase [Saprospiraceae bacterium]|nr:M20 family metallopeptidase [Saprospiraceae bacterium]
MDKEIISIVKEDASQLLPVVVRIRRDLHTYPELSFRESRTALKVKDFLSQHDIPYSDGWAGHGIVASIKGGHDGPMVMLRADMDALPIQEENDIPFRSVHDGVMHACGHDVHTSSLLGVAAILQKNRGYLKGEVRLIFQPGEEKLPGGASIMLREGLMKPIPPEWIIGQHVYPALPAGHVGFKNGLYMASADEIYLTVKGKGGHAATPHLCIDPILIASRLVVGLQEVISRNIDPLSPAVLTIGRFYSNGGATNIIPDTVQLEGTLRAMDETWRFRAHQLIRDFVEHTCKASGATAEINIVTGYPSLKNNDKITTMCQQAAVQYLGDDKVHELPRRMSSEDFAFYTLEAPGTFYRLGTGWKDEKLNFPVHSNRFNIDEAALETGMGLMAFMVLTNLS